MTFREAFLAALARSGRSLRSVATEAGVSYEQLKKINQGKSGSTNVDDAAKIASVFGLTLGELLAGAFETSRSKIAVAGKAGAGASVDLFDDFAKGDGLYHVATPSNLIGQSAVAVEIVGDSMEPVYSEGDVLFFVRHTHEGVPTEALNKKVIAHTADGRVWVKQIKAGSEEGKFNLLSINPNGENLWNAAVTWATPVLQHLPAEFVERIP